VDNTITSIESHAYLSAVARDSYRLHRVVTFSISSVAAMHSHLLAGPTRKDLRRLVRPRR